MKVVPPAPAIVPGKILLVTNDNVFLEGGLLALDKPADKVSPAAFDRGVERGLYASYNVIIFDGHTPSALPPASAVLYFHPTGAHAPFRISGHVSNPRVAAVNEQHPIMRNVSFVDTKFDETELFAGATPLVSAAEGPMVVASVAAGRRIIACGFELTATDLPLRTAFPLFLNNAVNWLEGKP